MKPQPKVAVMETQRYYTYVVMQRLISSAVMAYTIMYTQRLISNESWNLHTRCYVAAETLI